MQHGLFGKFLCAMALMAVPASAEFVTYNSSTSPIAFYDPLTNFTIIKFDGLGDQNCFSSCSGISLSGVNFFGFYGTPSSTNNVLQLVREDNSLATYYNFGGTGPDGNPVANPVVMRSAAAGNSSTAIGFRIVLPSAVTAFGVQIMGSVGSYNVAVKADLASISNPGGAYPAGTLTTAASHGRTFFGVTSTTPFTTIDIIGLPGIGGEYLVIDNLAFGTQTSNTAELQSGVFIISGLGMMLLARKMKRFKGTRAATA